VYVCMYICMYGRATGDEVIPTLEVYMYPRFLSAGALLCELTDPGFNTGQSVEFLV